MDGRKAVRYVVFAAAVILVSQGAWLMPAYSAPIPGDITADGSVELDSSFTTGEVMGGFSTIDGGTSTGSTYSGGTVTGSNPVTSTFSAIGDGIRLSGYSGASTQFTSTSDFFIGIDFLFNLANTSLTDSYEVTLRAVTANWVTSTGDDAYSESEFSISDSSNSEVFFSYLMSDTLDVGGAMSESKDETFSVTLAPGATETFDGFLTVNAEIFAAGTIGVNFTGDFYIDSIVNLTTPPNPVPEPGTFLLFASGIVGLAGFSRRRSRGKKYRRTEC